jgi:multiple sugar transport system ATP-binding protein
VLDAAGAANLSEITLGIRPESFKLSTDDSGLVLHVDLVEELGADAYVYGTAHLGDSDEQVVVRVADRGVPEMGQTIRLTVVPDETHVFNPESGERLG